MWVGCSLHQHGIRFRNHSHLSIAFECALPHLAGASVVPGLLGTSKNGRKSELVINLVVRFFRCFPSALCRASWGRLIWRRSLCRTSAHQIKSVSEVACGFSTHVARGDDDSGMGLPWALTDSVSDHRSGQSWPTFGQIWAIAAETGPTSARLGPDSARFSRFQSKFVQVWQTHGRIWPSLADIGTLGPDSSRFCRNRPIDPRPTPVSDGPGPAGMGPSRPQIRSS